MKVVLLTITWHILHIYTESRRPLLGCLGLDPIDKHLPGGTYTLSKPTPPKSISVLMISYRASIHAQDTYLRLHSALSKKTDILTNSQDRISTSPVSSPNLLNVRHLPRLLDLRRVFPWGLRESVAMVCHPSLLVRFPTINRPQPSSVSIIGSRLRDFH